MSEACDKAPDGWMCTRGVHEDGPCAAVVATKRPWPERFVALDVETGVWLDGSASLRGHESVRLAASVMPGMPEAVISKAYSDYMFNDPAPAVAVICGSTRFRTQMTELNHDLTLRGYIVLAPGVFAHDGADVTEAQKFALDDLHRRKIDLADEVYVVNPGHYIGESTSNEVEYAISEGKPVFYFTNGYNDV